MISAILEVIVTIRCCRLQLIFSPHVICTMIKGFFFNVSEDNKDLCQPVHSRNTNIRPKSSNTKASHKMTYANSVDPDQTAPEGAV